MDITTFGIVLSSVGGIIIVVACTYEMTVWKNISEDSKFHYDKNRFTGTNRKRHKNGTKIEYYQ